MYKFAQQNRNDDSEDDTSSSLSNPGSQPRSMFQALSTQSYAQRSTTLPPRLFCTIKQQSKEEIGAQVDKKGVVEIDYYRNENTNSEDGENFEMHSASRDMDMLLHKQKVDVSRDELTFPPSASKKMPSAKLNGIYGSLGKNLNHETSTHPISRATYTECLRGKTPLKSTHAAHLQHVPHHETGKSEALSSESKERAAVDIPPMIKTIQTPVQPKQLNHTKENSCLRSTVQKHKFHQPSLREYKRENNHVIPYSGQLETKIQSPPQHKMKTNDVFRTGTPRYNSQGNIHNQNYRQQEESNVLINGSKHVKDVPMNVSKHASVAKPTHNNKDIHLNKLTDAPKIDNYAQKVDIRNVKEQNNNNKMLGTNKENRYTNNLIKSTPKQSEPNGLRRPLKESLHAVCDQFKVNTVHEFKVPIKRELQFYDNEVNEQIGSKSSQKPALKKDVLDHNKPQINVKEESVAVSLPKVVEPKANLLTVKRKVYTVLSKLGFGGSSQVYQVLEPNSSHLLAVKCVNLAEADPATAQGYLNEIQHLIKLQSSDRVIRLYDHEFNKEQQMLYVVMEKGDIDLSTLLKKKKKNKEFSMPMIIYYWTEMLEAVKDIHDYGIVHSDLKPANFLLVGGRLKLIDFGIASAVQTDMTSTHKNCMVGTYNYMSPEAIQDPGDKSRTKVGYKSDVWSLGCILYNLLYGKTPFQHIGNSYVKLQVITNSDHKIDFPPIKNCPPAISEAVQRCLTYDSKLRPSVSELLKLPYIMIQRE